jgi:hypothetical protein
MGFRISEMVLRNSETGFRKSEIGFRESEMGRRESEMGRRKSESGRRKSEKHFRILQPLFIFPVKYLVNGSWFSNFASTKTYSHAYILTTQQKL